VGEQKRPSPEPAPDGNRATEATGLPRLTLLRRRQTDDWQGGNRRPVEEYLTEVERLADEDLLVLVVGELLLRRQRGENPDLAEYQRRFPHLAADLADQFELDDGLGATQVAGRVSPPQTARGLPAVPGFELLGEIGHGGMGVVYKARQLALDRIVAVKMMRDGALATPEELARFEREALLAARLQHANVVQVYEVVTHGGAAFLVMEHVEGRSLAQHAGGQPQPVRETARLIETLARAIHAAHELGVVHRDLKPANVLLRRDGVAKIVDFGLAREFNVDAARTQTGALAGTPAYMAPEQVQRAVGRTGPAADVWALGVMLYELLTGGLPFAGKDLLALLEQVLHHEPIAPRRLRPEVPRDLEVICLKCLRKEPARRYGSALEFAEDLRRFQAGEPISARPVGPLERAGRWARRNPGWAAMFAVVLGLLSLIAAGASLGVARLNGLLKRATDAEGQLGGTVSDLEKSEAELRDKVAAVEKAERGAKVQLFGSLLAQARANRLSRRAGQRFRSLELLAQANDLRQQLDLPPERALDLRNGFIAALAMPDLAPGKGWEHLEPNAVWADVDASWTIYARTDEKGNCSVRRLADDKELHRIAGQGKKAVVYLHPSGKWLVRQNADMSRAELWSLEAPEPREALAREQVTGVDVQAKGSLVAFAHTAGTLTVFDTATGKSWKAPGLAAREAGVSLHPTEPLAVVYSYFDLQYRLYFVDLGRRVVRDTRALPYSISQAAWSPDGGLLAVAESGSTIHLYDGKTWRRLRSLTRTDIGGGGLLSFNPAGDRIGVVGWASRWEVLDVSTGQSLFQTTVTPNLVARVRFSPDGWPRPSCCGRTLAD
jgi:tRNA A-37 threonylcarbamoyl transferase component Bud32